MTAVLRVIPQPLREAHRPQRVIERSLVVYRRGWLLIVSGLLEPLFYLFSIRVGAGKLIGDFQVGNRTVGYSTFVAPALLAAAAMNGAVTDSTINVFHKLRYAKTYDAMLATPLTPGDIAIGEIGWALLRGVLSGSRSPVSAWRRRPTCARGPTSSSCSSRPCRCSCFREASSLWRATHQRWAGSCA
jgi:lipooligosaccharide transport system permease protein